MEMEEIFKDQQAAIEEIKQLSEIENDSVELGKFNEISISYEAKNQKIQQQKMIEHLEKQNEILKNYIRNAEATETNAECLTDFQLTELPQKINEDSESEELQAGSNKMKTTAEVHFYDEKND